DPLVGGINAGAVDSLSLAATVPQLDAAVRSDAGSIIAACRQQRARVADPSAPVFYAPRGGMGALAHAVHRDAADRGLEVVSGRIVGVERSGRGWEAQADDGRRLAADAVVLATPAGATSELLRPHAPRAATLLAAIPYASVALLSIAVGREAVDRPL